jgi:outer membrane murein-binding lipoprotein Lpp
VSEGLDQISRRLRELAAELESESDEDRTAELVREASELATRAGQAVDQALRAGAAETTAES